MPADANSQRPFRTATAEEFPIIDVGPYLAGEAGALDPLAEQVRDAFARVGFMMLINHDLDWDVIDAAFAGSKQFHDLPMHWRQYPAACDLGVSCRGAVRNLVRAGFAPGSKSS